LAAKKIKKNSSDKTDADFWPEELAKGYLEDDQKVISTGDPVTLVEQMQKCDGKLSWVETYKAPVVISGEVVGTVGYARDVSEQKELFSAIHQKEQAYTTLLKNLPLSVIQYDIDAKRTIISLSDHIFGKGEVETYLGKTPVERWGEHIKNITAENYQNKIFEVIQSGEKQAFELHYEVEGEMFCSMVYLLPEFDEADKVSGVLAISNDVSDISKYRYNLEHLAYHDTLTALPNRALLNQRLGLAIASGERFGLMLMDLDLFKTINDTLGHAVGDELLKDVGARIKNSVRTDDVVARIGGDEFAILVENLKNDADLGVLAKKIAKKLSAPFNIEGVNFFVTASIGVACYPTDSEEVDDLMKFADVAMYAAKKQGRDNHQFYTPDLTQEAEEHLAIATALRYALPKQELSLVYQPKVDIATGHILGAEALLRWDCSVLGCIQPDKFIPVAEESGLIVEIGAWVLRTACEMAAQLNKHRDESFNMAVNVSSREFRGREFITYLKNCLDETGCKPEWLTIEITETVLMSDSQQMLTTLNAITDLGIPLSMDDFGTGYSALAYLSKFPISQVKIDRSFVMDICHCQNAASLVKAIIAMAASLNKTLVAEGIETQAQAGLIKTYGCDHAQGYLYSKPLPFSQLIHMVAQKKSLLTAN